MALGSCLDMFRKHCFGAGVTGSETIVEREVEVVRVCNCHKVAKACNCRGKRRWRLLSSCCRKRSPKRAAVGEN